MPARDFYHDVVKLALIADGWTITHDPLVLQWRSKDLGSWAEIGTAPLTRKPNRPVHKELERRAAPSITILGP